MRNSRKCFGDIILVFCSNVVSSLSSSSNSQQLGQCLSNSVQYQQIQPQQPLAQNLHQQPVNSPVRRQTYSYRSVTKNPLNGRLTYASRTSRPIIAGLPSETIDLISPPSSPAPQLTQEIERPPIVNVNTSLNIEKIAERSRAYQCAVQNTAAYMVS